MSFPATKSGGILGRKRRDTQVKGCKPQLTSLVDIMTILLVFLVKSFSTEGSVMNIPSDVTLPVSSAREMPQPSVIISVNNNTIVFEDKPVGLAGELLTSNELLIPNLYEALLSRRELTERIAEYSTKTEFKGDITIQGDRQIPFRLLQKIMYTCGRTGYNNFSLAVIQEE